MQVWVQLPSRVQKKRQEIVAFFIFNYCTSLQFAEYFLGCTVPLAGDKAAVTLSEQRQW